MCIRDRIATYAIALVAPDAQLGGTEIVMSSVQADAVGMGSSTRVLVYGQFDRAALDAQLGEQCAAIGRDPGEISAHTRR